MLPKVRIGEMRQRVTIQAMTSEADAYGDPVDTWSDVLTDVPAEVIYKTGRESVVSQQMRPFANWRVRMRSRRDIPIPDPTYRFVVQGSGKILTIPGGGDPNPVPHEWAFDCTEAVAVTEATGGTT